MLYNPVIVMGLVIEKGAEKVLLPVGCCKQLGDLSDDMVAKIDIQFYSDKRDARMKALVE